MLDKIKDTKPINGADGYYISSDGHVYKIQEIAQTTNNRGYQYVKLTTDQGLKVFSVHREVAKAYVDNPTNEETVDHIDGNKCNNVADNLQWMSHGDNVRKAFSKDVKVINEIGEVDTVKNVREFAKRHNIDPSTLSKVLSGKLNSTGGWRLCHAG